MTDNTQDTTGRRGLFDDPGRIAPHLDKDWRDRFIIEARLQGVDGSAIGDALVTADTHVQESGESAQEAFGDPKQYARDTAAASTGSPGTGMPWSAILGALIGLIGMFGAVSAAGAWQEGQRLSVTTGTTVALVLLMALATVVIRFRSAFLRLAAERRIPFRPRRARGRHRPLRRHLPSSPTGTLLGRRRHGRTHLRRAPRRQLAPPAGRASR
ncbi:MAG TPA: hypothetical protein GXZ60_11415 [Intrasporangiaceae bacterium]|nr:hypothetical protein [Intrasporangiaceae bacterium]